MDFLIVALVARIVGTAFLSSLFGAGLWLLGIMLVAPYSIGNAAVIQLSTILGFGLAAGVVAWVIELHLEELEGGRLVRLVAFLVVAMAMTATGLFLIGGVAFNDRGAYDPSGAHGTPELAGVRGVWRVAHRREP